MKESANAVYGEMADEFKDWVSLDKLVGESVTVNGYRLGDSNFNPGKKKATIDINFEGEPDHYGWSTEGAAIMDILEANQDNFPFDAEVQLRTSKKNGKDYPVLVGS